MKDYGNKYYKQPLALISELIPYLAGVKSKNMLSKNSSHGGLISYII